MSEEYRNMKISPDGNTVEGDLIQGKEQYHFQISKKEERRMARKEKSGKTCPRGQHWVKGHWQKKPEGRGRMYVRGHCAEDP